jgi:microcystin-dependent protein
VAQERTFNPHDPFPADWPNAAAALLDATCFAFTLRINPADATQLQVPAGTDLGQGTDNGRVSLAVQGRWRWIDASLSSAGPGGGTARTLDVFVTADDNVFTPSGSGEVDSTNRAFSLVIVESGATPSGAALTRKVATAQWTGTGFRSVSMQPGFYARAVTEPGVGEVREWAGSSDPNPSWMICDGRTLTRASYPQAWAFAAAEIAAGNTLWGSGDGSTTFSIPDTRGRVTVGAGTGAGLTNRALGAKFGEEAHVLGATEIAPHQHQGTTGPDKESHGHFFPQAVPGRNGGGGWAMAFFTSGSGVAAPASFPAPSSIVDVDSTLGPSNTHDHDFTTGFGGGPGPGATPALAHNTMQPSVAMNKIVRVV